jgi:hypothetical protein
LIKYGSDVLGSVLKSYNFYRVVHLWRNISYTIGKQDFLVEIAEPTFSYSTGKQDNLGMKFGHENWTLGLPVMSGENKGYLFSAMTH